MGCRRRALHTLRRKPGLEPGTNEARRTTAGSGAKLSALLRKPSPVGRCLRTLLESMMWGSAESFLSWRGSATKSGYALYRLVPSIRHRIGKDSGSLRDLWPTAQERDCKGITQTYTKRRTGEDTSKRGEALPNHLKAAFWLTVTNSEQSNRTRKIAPSHGVTHGLVLSGLLGNSLTGSNAPTKTDVPFAAYQLTFTSWLMGFQLEYLESFAPSSSPPLATPSSGRLLRK